MQKTRLPFRPNYYPQARKKFIVQTGRTALSMGLMDFFRNRQNDFVKLDYSTEEVYGPGPVIVFYKVPSGITNDELADMISDGAPIATKSCSNASTYAGVPFARFDDDNETMGGVENSNCTVFQVLNSVLENGSLTVSGASVVARDKKSMSLSSLPSSNSVPVIYFSGISNSEMIDTYHIIAKEIYEETGGLANAACAKAVEPAMNKSFKQVLEEISGDHKEALTSSLGR